MIDIHCHILPGIDDGARDITESAEMINTARLNKIDAIIATPHFLNFDKIEDFLFNRYEAMQSFEELLESFDNKPAVAYGAEVFLDGRVFTADNLDELTLNKSRYMLCEYTLNPFDTEKAVLYAEELCARGYIPIIAHPYIHKEYRLSTGCGIWAVNFRSTLLRLPEQAARICEALRRTLF